MVDDYAGWLMPYAAEIQELIASGYPLKKAARILWEHGVRTPAELDIGDEEQIQKAHIELELLSGGRYAKEVVEE